MSKARPKPRLVRAASPAPGPPRDRVDGAQAPPIMVLHQGVKIAPFIAQIETHPELWGANTFRTEGGYVNPHGKISDIIVRFNDWANWQGDRMKFCEPHVPIWWPAFAKLDLIIPLVFDLARLIQAEHIGMVLVTKIPAHSRVEPHKDFGWNAAFHDQYAVQLKANSLQRFCYEGYSIATKPGDLFIFRNDITHWVENNSDEDRWTLIISLRTRWTRAYVASTAESGT